MSSTLSKIMLRFTLTLIFLAVWFSPAANAQGTLNNSNYYITLPYTISNRSLGVCPAGAKMFRSDQTWGDNEYLCGLNNNWIKVGTSSVSSATALPVICTGVTATDSAALTAAVASAGNRAIVFVGACSFDQSSGEIIYSGFNGEIYGSPGSSIAFTTLTQNGLTFTGSNGIYIHDLVIKYATTATGRAALQAALSVQSSSNVRLERLTFTNSPASAMLLRELQHATVRDITCSGQFANCVFTANLVDAHISAVHSTGSGDAAVEVSYYAGRTLNACNQIVIEGVLSRNDVVGVLNNGCQKVTLANSTIDSSTYTAVAVIQDNATMGNNTTVGAAGSANEKHWPDDMVISNVVITNSGSGPTVSGFPNNSAAGISFQTGTNPSALLRVNLSNIRVINTKYYGILATNSGFNEWDIRGSLLTVDTTGTGTSGAGGIYASGSRFNCVMCSVLNAGGSSLSFNGTVSGEWSAFTSTNPNVGFGGSDNSIANSSTGTVIMRGITLNDTGVTPVSRINNLASTGTARYLDLVLNMPNGTWPGFTNSNTAGAWFTYPATTLVAGSNITLNTATPGQTIVSSSGGGGFTQNWIVTRTDATHLSIPVNAYPLNVGGTQCPINTVPSVASVPSFSGSGTIFIYVTPACVLTVGSNTTAPTCDANCTAAPGTVTAMPSDGSYPIATWTITASVLASTGTNYVTPYSTYPVSAGTNMSILDVGGVKQFNASMPAAIFSTLTDGATITWAIASAQVANAQVTLGGNRTLALTGIVNGGSYVLRLIQDGTGSRTVTLGSGCTWKVSGGGAGAITPSTAAASVDVLAFTYDGTNCYANFNKNFN